MNGTSQLKSFIKAKKGDYVVSINEACENNGEYTEAYPTGFPKFDDAMKPFEIDENGMEIVNTDTIGGVRDGDLIVITGLSGHGKTTFAQNLTKNFSENEKMPCLWFSYEVVINNLVAKFKSMKIDTADKGTLIYTPKKAENGDLKWIKDMIKEAQEKFYVKMIFIDHIDFLKAPDFSGENQRRIVLRDICQELKNIAIELKVVIFLMAHVKKVQGREIEMQDIAESSGIFQIADYMFAIRKEQEEDGWGGSKIKINTNAIKLLKNRPFGKQPSMNFKFRNNLINPL